MPTSLAFYALSRQEYAANVPPRDGEDEIMVGGYDDERGVDDRGEFAVVMHRFRSTGSFGSSKPDRFISLQLRAFGDATKALLEAIEAGILEVIEGSYETSNDVSLALIKRGFRDRSHAPLAETLR